MDLVEQNSRNGPLDCDKMSRKIDNSDGGVKVFGVTLRKSASTGNVCYSCTQPNQQPDQYASDGFVHNLSDLRPRKRGVPWTEEEHRSFLAGLEKLGKGDWRGISRSFVITRTPTQVASHAQKYFLRQKYVRRTKRRSSLFDISPHDYNHKARSLSVIMAEPDGLTGVRVHTSTYTSKDLALMSAKSIEEKGCGLSLSIAPPSLDSFQLYGRQDDVKRNAGLNVDSGIEVV